MSSSDSELETAALGREEAAGVVLADPGDRAYSVALDYAESSGRALRRWRLSDGPPRLSPEGGSVMLVTSWDRLDNAVVDALQAELGRVGPRARRMGILTAHSHAALTRLARRSRSLTVSRDLAPGWLLAGRALLPGRTRLAERIESQSLGPETARRRFSRSSAYGLIAGHGREDILYFEDWAICGQRRHEAGKRPCHPSDCSYSLPKIYIDDIKARVVVLLGCSAGRMGRGLFPAGCRLALSTLESSVACLTLRRLFSLTPALVERLGDLLEQGGMLGEVALRAGDWYRETVGEDDPFVLFGDPDLTLDGTGEAAHEQAEQPARSGGFEVVRPEPSAGPDDLAAIETQLLRMLDGMEGLRALGFLPNELRSLGQLLQRRERTLLRLLAQARAEAGARDTLYGVWRQLETLRRDLEQLLVQQLLGETLDTYFWLSSRYSGYRRCFQRKGHCLLCRSETTEEAFSHPFRRAATRIRTTCARCGIVEDRPQNGVSVRIAELDARVGREATRVHAVLRTDAGAGRAVLGTAVNKGRAVFRSAALVAPAPDSNGLLPGPLCLSGRAVVELDLEGVKPGVYFVKVFVIEQLHLTVASAPFTTHSAR